jgi:hypothetical protein
VKKRGLGKREVWIDVAITCEANRTE